METKSDVCGVEHVRMLDNRVRKWVHNPQRLFSKWVKAGDTVFDIGCGPGAFTLELAEMAGERGTVVAMDLQEEMLAIVTKKVEARGLHGRVVFHQCKSNAVEYSGTADFIVTFYMLHETSDPLRFVDEVSGMLKPGGHWFIAEPAFHVSKKDFLDVIARAEKNGLTQVERKGIVSRVALFKKKESFSESA